MMLLSLLTLPALGDNSGLDRQWADLAGVCSGPAPPVPTIVSIQAARAEGPGLEVCLQGWEMLKPGQSTQNSWPSEKTLGHKEGSP